MSEENTGEVRVINATKGQIEALKESVIWADIVRELEAWKEGYRREMESIVNDAQSTNPSTASVLLHMGHISGCTDAVNYLISMPDVFLEDLEIKKQSKEVRDGK